ncbi:hypothetical protein BCD48_32510 [Pseudofrankia sp. BMG5.36]|nr:hypothetical protein BCD48_32510 [Pseudofrankia sp. BMG5.36]
MRASRGLPRREVLPLDGDVSFADDVRAAAADDFGHVIRRMPLGVLRPASARDIAVAVRWAADTGRGIAARGQGHSTFGRSQVDGGVVVDMTGFDEIHRTGDDRLTVGAGATWRSVLAATLPDQLVPPVLPNFLDLSVGGTLAVGGVGGTTHRYGMQTDSVCELEVVTGEGRIVTCSPRDNPELFHSVRAGLGQFGIITRATLTLIPAPTRARRYTLAYPDLGRLAADQRLLLGEDRADHLQGAITLDAGPDGDARAWRHQLEMVLFHDLADLPDDDAVLAGLADERAQAQIEDMSYVDHVEAFDRFTELVRSTGEWAAPHLWWLTFLPGSAADDIARAALAEVAPEDLGTHGMVVFSALRTSRITTPLVRMPDDDIAFTFNLIRFAPPGPVVGEYVDRVLEQNASLYRRVLAAGGVLYPVSALSFRPQDWAEHFRDLWPAVREAKERFDPAHCLTPGYELIVSG